MAKNIKKGKNLQTFRFTFNTSTGKADGPPQILIDGEFRDMEKSPRGYPPEEGQIWSLAISETNPTCIYIGGEIH